MHTKGKIFVKTYLKAIRETFFPKMWNFLIYDIFIQQKGKFKISGLQRDPPSPRFPRLVGYPDLPMSKTLRVVGLLTVVIFFQSKKLAACKIKDKKEETIFIF